MSSEKPSERIIAIDKLRKQVTDAEHDFRAIDFVGMKIAQMKALLDFAEAADICFFCDDIDAEETRLQLLKARAALEAACKEPKP